MVEATPKGDVVNETADVENPDQLQFPSLAGEEGTEVAQRTIDGSDPEKFHKDFVVLYPVFGGKPTDDEDNRSRQAVLREAINLGLHPSAEPVFDGAEKHPDGTSTIWNYSVTVTPAAVDHDAETTVTPAHSDHQPAND